VADLAFEVARFSPAERGYSVKASNTRVVDPPRRCRQVSVDVCPACGYPTIGPELCAFCRPVEMLRGDMTFERNALLAEPLSRSWMGPDTALSA